MPPDPARFDRGRPDPDERARIAAGLGAELRHARGVAGLSQRRLAELSGVSRRMVQALEAGHRRPRESLLAALAAVIAARPMERDHPRCAPDVDELTGRLVAAAGASLAAETPHSARRRTQRTEAARQRAHLAQETLRRPGVAARPHERPMDRRHRMVRPSVAPRPRVVRRAR